MAVGDAHEFPDFLTPVLTHLFFSNPPTSFLTCSCIVERQKYAGKKVCLKRGSNSQPPGHNSDTITIETPGQGPNKLVFTVSFTCQYNKSFENNMGKEQLLIPSFFSFFQRFSCFLENFQTFPIKFKIIICKLTLEESKFYHLGELTKFSESMTQMF